MENLITSGDVKIDITQTTDSNPGDIELNLILKGEASNANSLGALRHVARATTNNKNARAAGLKDTQLVTRNLSNIDLDVAAHALNFANWGWGLQNVQLEAERNRVGMAVNINVIGSTSGTNDPTYDPSIGIDASKAELSELADVVALRAEADARNYSNQATAYGINGGHATTDKIKRADKLSTAPDLRQSLLTNGGDDKVSINAQASNTGLLTTGRFDRPGGPGRDFGKQRAVAIYNSLVDLGTGNDSIELKSEVLLSNPFTPYRFSPESGWQFGLKEKFTLLPGASELGVSKADVEGLFDGATSETNDLKATGAADLYEAGLDAGDGNDNVSLYNGWDSDIWLGAGDDTVNLSAGKELFIQGGAGTDTANFTTKQSVKDNYPEYTDPVYKGTKKFNEGTSKEYSLHVVSTFEGNVYLDRNIEKLFINGTEQTLTPIKGPDPVTLSVVESTIVEGGRMGVRVLRAGPLNGTTVASVAIASGTAEEGADFAKQAAQQVSFVPGQTEAVAFFDTIDDKIVESDESIKVTLTTTTPEVVVSSAESVFVLTDNDKARSTTKFSIADAEVEEGKPASIVINREGDLSEAQSVQITTRALTASALDVKLSTLTASFLPGEKSVEVGLETLDDELAEDTETVQIIGAALINSGSAETNWKDADAVLKITDNDQIKPASTFKFKEAVVNVEEGKKVTIIVERTGDLSTSQLVQVKSAAGANSDSEDFEEKVFNLTFPKNSASQSFSIKTTADKKADSGSFLILPGSIFDTGKVQGTWADGNVQVNILEPVVAGKYSIAANENAIDEGASLNVVVNGEGLKAGSTVYYRISGAGVTKDDFEGGPLSGPITVGSNGKVNFELKRTAVKDFSSDESEETAIIQVFANADFSDPLTDPAEVVINDTSIGDPEVLTFGGAVQGFKVGTEGKDTLTTAKSELNKSWALWGLGGVDKLTGGNKNDYLVSGMGADTMTGGKGQDSFLINDLDPKGVDTITDFNPKDDTLVIPIDVFDASPEEGVAVIKYNQIKDQRTASRTFDDNPDAVHYILVDTLANIKKVNSTKLGQSIFLAIDTTGRNLLKDDDGNWFKGSQVLAKLPKATMTGWSPNNFALGFDFGGGTANEDEELNQAIDPGSDPLA